MSTRTLPAQAPDTIPAAPASPGAAQKGSLLWVQGLACGALLTFAAPTALLLGVLLAPAIACIAGEREAGRGTARAVALCCAAAALRPLWHLWAQNDRMDTALSQICEPLTLITAWGAGALGWALCQVLPVLIRLGWDAREAAHARAIQAELARIHEEWDLL